MSRKLKSNTLSLAIMIILVLHDSWIVLNVPVLELEVFL